MSAGSRVRRHARARRNAATGGSLDLAATSIVAMLCGALGAGHERPASTAGVKRMNPRRRIRHHAHALVRAGALVNLEADPVGRDCQARRPRTSTRPVVLDSAVRGAQTP
jgi:hypothetical protein